MPATVAAGELRVRLLAWNSLAVFEAIELAPTNRATNKVVEDEEVRCAKQKRSDEAKRRTVRQVATVTQQQADTEANGYAPEKENYFKNRELGKPLHVNGLQCW